MRVPFLKSFTTAICFLSLAILSNNAQASTIDTASLVVKTSQGLVRGSTKHDICVWKGIRYAKPPVGDLRFHNPQPAESWTGVKDATAYGPVSYQMKRILVGNEQQSEDCLSLNIWSPGADGKKRPVMFWIHGGGFIGGSGSSDMYDGTQIAKNGDVVVVTINYRLGPLDFLYFKDMPGNKDNFESNLGIKDQVAALKWVKENIAAFGGDPNAVTIFGESAGGISVETLMAVPAANGLFKRAIAESGPAGDVWTTKTSTLVTTLFLKELGLTPESAGKLKELPADSLVSAMTRLVLKMKTDPTLPKTFAPTVDGDYLPHDLLTEIHSGRSKGVDLLIGTNKDEANLFAMKKLKIVPVSEQELKPYLVKLKPEEQKQLIGAYKDYPSRNSILELITDGIFTMPSIKFAELQSEHANTFMYRFDWASKPIKAVGLGACHGLEIPFVFGTFHTKLGKKVLLFSDNKRIHELSKQIQQAWINFARTGNPGTQDLADWKKYDSAVRCTIIFDKKNYCTTDPKAGQRKAWGDLNFLE